MESIAKALVSFLELLEAEGRTLREKTALMFSCFIFMLIGALLLAVAVCTASYAGYVYLSVKYGVITALLIVAAVLAALGLLLISEGHSSSRPAKVQETKSAALSKPEKEGNSDDGAAR